MPKLRCPLVFSRPEEYEELCERWHLIAIWIIEAPALSRESNPSGATGRRACVDAAVGRGGGHSASIVGHWAEIRHPARHIRHVPLCTRLLLPSQRALFATSPCTEQSDLKDLGDHLTNYEITVPSRKLRKYVIS
jgi:hypothetical protein